MKKYSVTIENSLKSAFFTVQNLREDKNIIDEDVNEVIEKLQLLITKSQNGGIDND